MFATRREPGPALRESSALARDRRAFTLVELVVVMLILSLLMGAGVGLLSGFSPAKNAASGMVRNTLRSAQSSAAATQSPTVVNIDKARGVLSVNSLRVVGTWHFEGGRLSGAFGMEGVASAGLFVEDGYIGGAFSLAKAGSKGAKIPIADRGGFDLGHGFLVQFVVRRDGPGGGQVLSIGETLVIEVGQSGEVRARFGTSGEGLGESGRSARVTITSPAGMLQPERWARVAVRYDRRYFQVEVEDLVVASFEESSRVKRIEDPLVLAGGGRAFPGSIDNLVISAIELGEEMVLPEGVLIEKAPDAIYFQAGGGLDRKAHPGPANVELLLEDGSRDVFSVGVFGTAE